jgi:hypothetical protein
MNNNVKRYATEDYVEENIKQDLDTKLNNSELAYAIELSDELMPTTFEWSGTGWI